MKSQQLKTLTEQRMAINVLKFSYIAAFGVILITVVAGYLINRDALAREVHARTVATLLDAQETHSQRLLRNTLLLLAPGDHNATITEMQQDEVFLQKNNANMVKGAIETNSVPDDFTDAELTRIRTTQPAFAAMTSATDTLLMLSAQQRETTDIKALVPSITTMFYQEPIYFSALKFVYDDLNAQADARVGQVKTYENLLLGIYIFVAVGELVFIARPALKQLENSLGENK